MSSSASAGIPLRRIAKFSLLLLLLLPSRAFAQSFARSAGNSNVERYAHFQRGISASTFEPRLAEAIWRDWTQHYSDSSVGPFYLGLSLLEQGRASEAIDALRLSIDLNEHNAIAHHTLSTALRQTGQIEAADAALTQAIARYPSDASAHCDLSAALQNQYRFEDAEQAARNALLADPDYAFAVEGGWHTLCEFARFNQTLPLLEAAARANPTEAHWHYRLGAARDRQGDWSAAIEAYQQAIAIEPTYTDARLRLAASQSRLLQRN